MSWKAWWVVGVCVLAAGASVAGETWRGLVVAPEERCAPYDRKRDYSYSQTVERRVVKRMGMIYGHLLRLDAADGY